MIVVELASADGLRSVRVDADYYRIESSGHLLVITEDDPNATVTFNAPFWVSVRIERGDSEGLRVQGS